MAKTHEVKLTDAEIALINDALIHSEYPNASKLSSLWNNKKAKERLIYKISIKPKKQIKPSSAKAKGRKLQQWTMLKIAQLLNYKISSEKDLSAIKSGEMGQAGVDVVIKSAKMRRAFPFAVECKNQEQVSLPAWLRQAQANISDSMPHFMLITGVSRGGPSACAPRTPCRWMSVAISFSLFNQRFPKLNMPPSLALPRNGQTFVFVVKLDIHPAVIYMPAVQAIFAYFCARSLSIPAISASV